MRFVAALLAAIGLLAGPAGATAPPLRGTLAEPALWKAYKQAFLSAGGRVIDNANGGISHSEGQGYGMLLAVAADDPEAFASLWAWTRAQLMLRDDGLAAWRWDPAATPHVADRNNAADGDVLIAWALAEAGEAWSEPAYKAAALLTARAIVAHDVVQGPFGPMLRPGSSGFSAAERADGPVVNPSYWVFPAFARLEALTPDPAWAALTAAGLRLLAAARFGPRQLPGDWVSLASTAPAPAAGFPATFGYDAVRIPLYLVWAGLGDARTLAPYAPLFADPGAVPHTVDLPTGDAREALGDSGYRAVAALTRCALHRTPLPLETRSAAVDRYYPTTLRALVLVATRRTIPPC